MLIPTTKWQELLLTLEGSRGGEGRGGGGGGGGGGGERPTQPNPDPVPRHKDGNFVILSERKCRNFNPVQDWTITWSITIFKTTIMIHKFHAILPKA